MHFIVHALDKTDALERRMASIANHRAYLSKAPSQFGVKVLMSGPLLAEDGNTMIGSFFLLASKSRIEVEAMFEGDPLRSVDVWQSLKINPVQVRQNTVGALLDM
jgi:uncharacterized protein YciI